MVELSQKIKKKIYKFELKKRYQYEKHYRVKEKPPIERIKEQFRAMLKPKKVEREATAEARPTPPAGGFNFIVFGAFIFIAIIILGMAWLYLTISIQPGPGVFQPQVEKSTIYNTIEAGELLTTGQMGSPKYMAAVMVNYTTTNLKNYSVTISTYNEKIPSEVFVLNSERKGATTYPDFLRALRSNLAKRKIMLNEISLKQLETIPEGAIVIVPSGVVPKELIGIDSQVNMNKLADRGVVVIYIGKQFKEMLNGTDSVFTSKDVLTSLPVRFDETAQLTSTEGFHLFQPLYRATPSGGWGGGIAYGSVSIIKKGNGAFIFVPQTLDAGWRNNFTSAADDIARIIFEIPWAPPNSAKKEYVFTNKTSYAGREYFFSEPFDAPNVTARLDFVGYSSASNLPVMETLYVRIERTRNNSLFIEEGGKVVSANITNLPTRVNAQLREPYAAQPAMYLVVVDSAGNEIHNFPLDNVDVQGDHSWDELIYVDRGEYIVRLIDDMNTIYAETYMKVVSIDITYQGIDREKKSVYKFDITMDGTPKSLSEISVRVDKGQYGTYTFNNVNKLNVDVGRYTGGESLPLGTHTFDFTSGGLRTSLTVEHLRPKTIFDDPMFWVTILLTCGIVAVGIVFARQESVYFAIDIPDFPPVARTKIPLTSDVILSVFEKVNESYRWQNTPLTAAEVKNGFKSIFYQGKPIYITDYNVEYLLLELEKRGLVKESLDYFGLTAWEERSGHSIEYLALMRRLRDICVNNAIPFTGIGESKEADSVITVVGQQMSLHFYERQMDVKVLLQRVIPTIGRGIAIILFKNQADKEYFQSIINSSPTVGPLIIKMEMDSSSLLLQTVDELEKMLVEFKSM